MQCSGSTARISLWVHGAALPLGLSLALGALLGCGGLAEGGEQRPPPFVGSPDGVPGISVPSVPREELPLPPEASTESAPVPAPMEGRCSTRSYARGSVNVFDQAGLDALRSCSQLLGDLTIHPFDGADLRPLAGLSSVGGRLTLGNPSGQASSPAFPSLAGLDALQHVGSLVLNGVQAASLENLALLQSVGGGTDPDDGVLQLVDCPKLRDLGGLDRAEGFQNVYIDSCSRLISLNGLLVGSELDALSVSNTPLSRLDALNDLHQVNGSLTFNGTALRNAGGLDVLRRAAQLMFQDNALLANLSALDVLLEVQDLVVVDNSALQILPTFSSLITLGTLIVQGNSQLEQMGGIPRLSDVQLVSIQQNPVLTKIAALGSVRTAQSIQVDYNPALTELDLSSLESVSSMLHVAYNPQFDGTQLAPPPRAGGAVIIGGNRGDQLSLNPCPWSGDGVCVGPPYETLCAAGADSDCQR